MRVVRFRLAVVVALALFAVQPPAIAAAQQTESRIVGRFVDDSRAALPGVTVTVTAQQTGAVRTVVAERDGSYVVTNLAPGAYSVQLELAGFAPQTRTVVLGLGQVETLDVTLGLATLQ